MEKNNDSETIKPDSGIKKPDSGINRKRILRIGTAALIAFFAQRCDTTKSELINHLDAQQPEIGEIVEPDQIGADADDIEIGAEVNGEDTITDKGVDADVAIPVDTGEDTAEDVSKDVAEDVSQDAAEDVSQDAAEDVSQEAQDKEGQKEAVEQCETAQAKSLKIEIENGAVKGQVASGLAEDIVKSGGGNFDIKKSLCTGKVSCEFSVSFDSSDQGKTFVIGFVVPAGANVNAQKLSDLLPGNAQTLGGYTVFKAELAGGGFRDGSNTPQPTDIKNALEQISEALTQENNPYKDNPEKSLEGVSGVGKAESIFVNLKEVKNTAGNDFEGSNLSVDTLFILAVPVTVEIDSCKLAQEKTRRDFFKLFKTS